MTLTGPIYFDNAASTPVLPEALEKMQNAHETYYANSSSNHKLGRQAQDLFFECCETLGKYFDVPPNHVIFTSGGTESNNLAAWGALGGLLEGVKWLKSGSEGRLITSKAEHPSNTKVFDLLEQMGASVKWIGLNQEGFLKLEDLEKELESRTRYLSFHHVQSETGTAQKLSEINHLIRRKQPDAIFHTDAVQSFMKLPLNFDTDGVDMLSISSHKIGGPKGIGALILSRKFQKRSQPKIGALIHGSSQQHGVRPGTVPVPLIAGFLSAVELGVLNFDKNIQKLSTLKERLASQLPKDAHINTAKTSSTPQTLNFSIIGLPSAVAVEALSSRGFCVSAGSACNSSNPKPNATLIEMGKPQDIALSSIRISLSPKNTEAQIDSFIAALNEVIEQYRLT